MSTDTASRHASAPAPGPGGPRAHPWILMYHSVGDASDDPYGITVTPQRLDHQLRWLTRRGLTGVGVGALLRARAAGHDRGLVGLTFDDGYADFTEQALPLLKRHGCTATLFVLPGRLGGENAWDPLGPRKPLLTEAGIRAAAGAGVEVGSHGMYHQDLTVTPDGALHEETRGSRELLRELTGTTPEGFCYPYGTLDRRAVGAVRDAGYAYGCAIDPGPLGGVLALPRAHISHADRGLRLHAKRLRHEIRQLGPVRPISAGPGTSGTSPSSRLLSSGGDPNPRRIAEMPTGNHPAGTPAPCDAARHPKDRMKSRDGVSEANAVHRTPRADPTRPTGQDLIGDASR